MKILQVIPDFGQGGAEVMCVDLTKALYNSGNIVKVISLYDLKSCLTDKLINNNIDLLFLNKKSGFDFKLIRKIRKIVKSFNPDIIHTHLYALKYVELACLGINVKIIHTIHNVADKEVGIRERRFNKIWIKKGKVIPIALSSIIKETILKEYKINDCHCVLNGIDLEQCHQKDNYNKLNHITFVTIGRLESQKNYEMLIRAFADVVAKENNVILKIIGSGSKEKELKSLCKNLNIEKEVLFLGYIDNVYSHLYEADVFVLSSLYEGLPITLIEATATGLPIISTNVGAVSDIVEDSINGFLVNTVQEMTNKMIILCENEELRKTFGRASINKSEDFSSKGMAQNYLNIYMEYAKREN